MIRFLCVASLLLASLLLGACGDDRSEEGEPCSTSVDCTDGLLCDTTRSPPTCENMLSPHPDLAGADFSHADLSGVVEDLAHED